MDPVVRGASDVRRLLSEVKDPFDKGKVVDYVSSLAEELGFVAVKNMRVEGMRIDCGWRDGQRLFLASNVEFGNEREILGAATEIITVNPEIGLLITASNSLKPLTNVVNAVRKISSFDFIILDVKEGRSTILR